MLSVLTRLRPADVVALCIPPENSTLFLPLPASGREVRACSVWEDRTARASGTRPTWEFWFCCLPDGCFGPVLLLPSPIFQRSFSGLP